MAREYFHILTIGVFAKVVQFANYGGISSQNPVVHEFIGSGKEIFRYGQNTLFLLYTLSEDLSKFAGNSFTKSFDFVKN